MSAPRISLVVAVRNGAATLPHCLETIMAQTYPHVEVLVMDGGSTDGTVDILQAHTDKIAVWESAPDRGIYHAWNKALAHATGDWIGFIGSDDFLWTPDALERMAAGLPAPETGIRIAYGQIAVLSASGDVVRYEGRTWEESKPGLQWTLPLPHPGLLHRRDLFDERGPFDEDFRIVGDYELLLRELGPRSGGKALFIPGVTTVGFGHGGVSHSPRAMRPMLTELARVRRRHGTGRGLPSQVWWKMVGAAWTYRLVGDDGFRRLADGLRRLRGKPAIWQDAGAQR